MEKACSRCTVQSLQVPQSRSEYLHSSHLVDSTRRAIRAGEDTEFRCLSHWEAELSRRCWNLLRLSRHRGWWRRMWRGGGSRRWESRQLVATKYDCWWSLFGQCQHLYCSLVSWIVGGGEDEVSYMDRYTGTLERGRNCHASKGNWFGNAQMLIAAVTKQE